MVRPSSHRTAMLFQIYHGLLAVSLVLSAVLAHRHLTGSANSGSETVIAAPREPSPARAAAPTIKWGGLKR